MAGIEGALHDLCQPLTVLQCKLELGLLQGGEDAIHSAVVDGLRECRRLNAVVKTMRELVERPDREEELESKMKGTR
jgi:signal transduction histidine kinase